MAYLIACLAAGGSFLINRLLLRQWGVRVIITLSPVVEEMLKTAAAYYFAADILVTHLVFGLIEAVYDLAQSQGKAMAAAMSVIGHGLFGGATVLAAGTAGIYAGLAVGIMLHLLWNTIMLRWVARNR